MGTIAQVVAAAIAQLPVPASSQASHTLSLHGPLLMESKTLVVIHPADLHFNVMPADLNIERLWLLLMDTQLLKLLSLKARHRQVVWSL